MHLLYNPGPPEQLCKAWGRQAAQRVGLDCTEGARARAPHPAATPDFQLVVARLLVEVRQFAQHDDGDFRPCIYGNVKPGSFSFDHRLTGVPEPPNC